MEKVKTIKAIQEDTREVMKETYHKINRYETQTLDWDLLHNIHTLLATAHSMLSYIEDR